MHNNTRQLSLFTLLLILGLSVGVVASCGPTPAEQEGNLQETQTQDGSTTVEVTQEQNQSELTPDGEAEEKTNPPESSEKDTTIDPEVDIPESILRLEILTPSSFAPIEFKSTEWSIPASGQDQKKLHFAIHANLTPMFGGDKGLFVVETKSILQVDKKKVLGLSSWTDGKVVVAYPDQLYLWDGKVLSPTNFFKNLDGSPITTIAYRTKDSFWMGTEKSLWMLDKDQLQEFPQVKGVKTLVYAPSKKILLVQDAKGTQLALSETNGKWTTRSFGNEGVTLKILTSTVDKDKQNFWGMDDQNTLLVRKVVSGDEAAWWGFRLKPDKDDNETISIEGVFFQYNPEQTWAIAKDEMYRLTEGVSRVLKRPASLKTILTANSTLDGSIWLSDGKKLVRYGESVPAVTYAKDVEPIIKSKCLNCHKAGGRASFRPFETYQQVRDKATVILQRIDVQKNMPPGKPLPASEIATIKSWIAGGFQP